MQAQKRLNEVKIGLGPEQTYKLCLLSSSMLSSLFPVLFHLIIIEVSERIADLSDLLAQK